MQVGAQVRPSSVCPSQSSSIRLQVSAVGWLTWTQAYAPLIQDCFPVRHAPRLLPKVQFAAGMLLSTCPSQSSSLLLQLSTCGVTWPRQDVHVPPVQDCVPDLQVPFPDVPVAPV